MIKKAKILLLKLSKFFYTPEKFARYKATKIAKLIGVKIGDGCRLYSTDFSSEPYLISIGNHVSISEGVKFITHDGGTWVIRWLYEEWKNCNIVGEIKIGNNVFIGTNAILLPGITIGDNCIIGTGSIITKSVPENSVIAGVPAKRICDLYTYIENNKQIFLDTKQLSNKEREGYLLSLNSENNFRNR